MKVTVLVFDQPTDVYYNLAGGNESYVTKQMGFIGVEGDTSSLKDGQQAPLHTLQCNRITGAGFYGGAACFNTQNGDYFTVQQKVQQEQQSKSSETQAQAETQVPQAQTSTNTQSNQRGSSVNTGSKAAARMVFATMMIVVLGGVAVAARRFAH